MLLYNEKNITPILKQITNLISQVLILYFRVNISLRPEKREQELGIEKEKCTQLILQFLTTISKEAKLEIDLATLNIEALNKHTTYNPEEKRKLGK